MRGGEGRPSSARVSDPACLPTGRPAPSSEGLLRPWRATVGYCGWVGRPATAQAWWNGVDLVSGKALAAGVSLGQDRKIPAASALPLTDSPLVQPVDYQIGSEYAPLEQLLQADLLGRKRPAGKFDVGPLVGLPLDGSAIKIDPRRMGK